MNREPRASSKAPRPAPATPSAGPAGPHAVAIVGGGAAGLMAAVAAARAGAATLLVERGPRPGRKILVTGNGRCNLTNVRAGEVAGYRSREVRFAHGALARLDVAATLAFFEGLGLAFTLEGERYFPRSGAAADVADALIEAAAEAGVEIVTGARVTGLIPGRPWTIELSGRAPHTALAVVLAAGGAALPRSGSDGAGFALAGALGLALVPPAPALVPLAVRGNLGHHLQGVKLPAGLRAPALGAAAGPAEVMFAHYGLSGPLALDLSLEIAAALAGGPVGLELDFLPETDERDLAARLRRHAGQNPRRGLGRLLLGILPRRALPAICRQLGLDPDQPAGAAPAALLEELAARLKAWPLECTGSRGWDEAAATLGGVDTRELDPRTLGCRRIPGLFLAGELIDICGQCGGFNLQWAWSSGHLAGLSAAAWVAHSGPR